MLLIVFTSVCGVLRFSSTYVFSQRHAPAAPRAGDRSYVTGSIHGWSRSHLAYVAGGCWLEERKLTSQSPSITVEFSVQYNLKKNSVISLCLFITSCQISLLAGKIFIKQYRPKQKFGFKFVKFGDESSLCSAIKQNSAVAEPNFATKLLLTAIGSKQLFPLSTLCAKWVLSLLLSYVQKTQRVYEIQMITLNRNGW